MLLTIKDTRINVTEDRYTREEEIMVLDVSLVPWIILSKDKQIVIYHLILF